MNRFGTYAFRLFAPFMGLTLLSSVASARVMTEIWQVKGVHDSADEAKIRAALVKLPSVTNPLVSMSTVRATFDDQKVTDAAFKAAVANAGRFELISKLPAETHHPIAPKPHK